MGGCLREHDTIYSKIMQKNIFSVFSLSKSLTLWIFSFVCTYKLIVVLCVLFREDPWELFNLMLILKWPFVILTFRGF